MYMYDYPKTEEEAKEHRYREWAGNPSGNSWVPGKCAMEVPEGGRSVLFHQCNRKSGHGPGNLYCKQHAIKITEYENRQRSNK